jgi:hypothetical protein
MYRLVRLALLVLTVQTDQMDPMVLPVQTIRPDQLVQVVLEVRAVHLDLEGLWLPWPQCFQRAQVQVLRLSLVCLVYLHSLVGQCLQSVQEVLLVLLVLLVRCFRLDPKVLVSPYLQQVLQALTLHLVPFVQRDLGVPIVRLVLGPLMVLEVLRVQPHPEIHLVQPDPRGLRGL